MSARSSVAVIGGGVLGMAMAARLAELGHRVLLFEKKAGLGGLAVSEPIGEFKWDLFYHVILLSDRHLLEWLERLGLSDALRWGRTRTGFYVDGKLHSLSSSWEFARFPAIGLWDKCRLALTILRASRLGDPEHLERLTALEWLTRWSGPRVVAKLWRPLLQSKLGAHVSKASAAFIWAIIARMYAARRSGLKTEQFGYVEGGYGRILAEFENLLQRLGVETISGSAVAEVRDQGPEVTVTLEDGSRFVANHAVLTVPCPAVSRLCPQLTDRERERLERVVYQGVICPSFLLRRPLGGYYVTNLTDPELPFTGVIEMTALVDRSAFAGNTLVYLPRYLAQDDPLWQTDDATVARSFFEGLRTIYPQLSDRDIVSQRVGRAREVMAVSTLDYSRVALPPVDTSQPRISLVNSAQIAYGTLNVNETLGLVAGKLPRITGALEAVSPAGAAAE